MSATETLMRQRVKSVIEAAFSAEGWTVESTKLLRAAGRDGRNRVATSPLDSPEDSRVVVQLNVRVLLQVYLAFDDDLDENRVVDPSVIEGYADRIRTAMGAGSAGSGNDLWGLRVQRIDFPDDPTGHKTRLEATILGYGNNQAAAG